MPASLIPGLVSVTFRSLSAADVIEMADRAKLKAIEWGGDVHVPHGDINKARVVGRQTRDAGIEVAAYGSYYRVGVDSSPCFEDVLATAQSLEAPLIRVWAGDKDSADASDADWERVIEDMGRICSMALTAGIRIACEYHGGTLTDTVDSTCKLLSALPDVNLYTLWQPPTANIPMPPAHDVATLLPRIANVHTFTCSGGQLAALRDGADAWRGYLDVLNTADRQVCLLIEFVRGESLAQFEEDAATLLEWVSRYGIDPPVWMKTVAT